MKDNTIGILLLLDVQVRSRATASVMAGVLVHD